MQEGNKPTLTSQHVQEQSSVTLQVNDVYGSPGNMHFMTSGNKKVAAAAISRIQCGGGTNLSAGLFRGVDHHQQSTTEPADGSSGTRVHPPSAHAICQNYHRAALTIL